MRYAGVPIGVVALDVPSGLAYGVLTPGTRYDLVRAQVEDAGHALFPDGIGAGRYWPATRGDFADFAASSVAGGYDIQDLRGMPVSAASVSVFAPPSLEGQPYVVVDFRPQAAHVFAVLPQSDPAPGSRRPAA